MLKQFVTAAANRLAADYPTDYLRSNVHYIDCLVDRICTVREATGGRVRVKAEEYHEWILKTDRLSEAALSRLRALCNSRNILLANRREFDFFDCRKRWLVTGIQLAVAAYGLARRYRTIGEALADDDLRSTVERLQLAFGFGLLYQGRVKQRSGLRAADWYEIQAYNDLVMERLRCAADDSLELRLMRELVEVRRQLSALGQPTAANEILAEAISGTGRFLAKLSERILEPVKMFDEFCAEGLALEIRDGQPVSIYMKSILPKLEQELRQLVETLFATMARYYRA